MGAEEAAVAQQAEGEQLAATDAQQAGELRPGWSISFAPVVWSRKTMRRHADGGTIPRASARFSDSADR